MRPLIRLLALCLLLFPAGNCSADSPDQSATISVGELIAGLARTEGEIKDLEVMISAHKLQADLSPKAPPKRPVSDLLFHCRSVVDASGRMREEGFGQQTTSTPDTVEPLPRCFHWLTVYDGTESREFKTQSVAQLPMVSIHQHPSWYVDSPLEFTTQYFREPISESLRDDGGSVVGTGRFQGRSVVIAETKPFVSDAARKMRFAIDVERNFTVLRREIMVQFTGESDWKTYSYREGKQLQQCSGVWLPTEVVYESVGPHPGDKPADLLWRDELKLSDWKVNQSPPASVFQSPIPQAAWVNDHRSPDAKVYQFGVTADAAAKPQKRPDIYDPKADAAVQVGDALATAKPDGKRVLLMYGGNWCGWCHKLHDVFEQDEAIHACLEQNYELVMIDIESDRNKAVAASYEADWQKHGVPYLTVLDAEGKVLANQNTGDLEEGPNHDSGRVLEFLSRFAVETADK